MHLFNSGKWKMMMQGDFDLNTVQIYTNSVKEVLKQTMLNQDVVFRNQVLELHRLYRVQESLMKDFGWKECNGYNSWSSKAQSSLLPLTNPTRYGALSKDTRFSSIAKVGSTTCVRTDLLKDSQGTYHKLQRRHLDLQLSADAFIDIVEEDIPMKGNVQNCLEAHVDINLPICGCNSPNKEELNLTLSTGGEDRTMEGIMRTCLTKKTYPSSQTVIDLEEPVERMQGRTGLEVHSKGKHESKTSPFSGPTFSINANKDPCPEIAESSSLQEYSECCQDQTFSSEGIRNDVPSDDLSTKMQQFTSCQGEQLDLNKVHLDGSSCCSEDHMLTYPSTASSEGGSHGLTGCLQDGTRPTTFQEKVNECLNEAPEMLKQDNKAVNLAFVDFNQKNKSTDSWTRNTGIISGAPLADSESMLMPPAGISKDHKKDNVELKPELALEVSSEKSEVENAPFTCPDQSQNSGLDGNGNQSPDSCRSYCISDNDSSSAKTNHSAITSGVLNQCLNTHFQSHVVDILTVEHHQKTSESNDIKNDGCSEKKESAKVDVLIHQAAELLIQISLEHSACDQDSVTKVKSSKEIEDRKRERAQCSYDSFELLVLNQTESDHDDNSASSKPFEVNDIETKDFGHKYKRGRRMKDFQKEILPSLASLSRHEILEDINIMEGVLRSREYRKFRAKMASQIENWTAPVRSKRSRLNYAGRRKFS